MVWVVAQPGDHDGVQGAVELAVTRAIQPMPGHLARRCWDRVGAGQGGKGGLRPQPPSMGPADQHLRGADRPHPGQLQQPGRDSGDQPLQLSPQFGGLDRQQLDAVSGRPQRPDGHAMLQRPGWPIPQQRAPANLPLGPKPTKLGPQLLRRPHDQRLELVDSADLGHTGAAPTSYVCPMHPEVTSDEPGRCPKCGMKLLAAASVPKPAAADAASAIDEHGGEAAGHGHHADGHEHGNAEGIEWEDDMVEVNRLTTTATMHWKFLDRTSGADSPAIDWRFTVGDRVKLRLVNEIDSDHPMHHPFHLHGAGRFLVLSRDGVPEPNLVWKDTVLVRTGQVVDILFDVSNPGLWMAHCHIAEHMQSGMMFSFNVARDQAVAP